MKRFFNWLRLKFHDHDYMLIALSNKFVTIVKLNDGEFEDEYVVSLLECRVCGKRKTNVKSKYTWEYHKGVQAARMLWIHNGKVSDQFYDYRESPKRPTKPRPSYLKRVK